MQISFTKGKNMGTPEETPTADHYFVIGELGEAAVSQQQHCEGAKV